MSSIMIQGLSFEVPAPYVAGPATLSEGEAHTLNQTLAENVRNNFAKKVAEAKDAAEKAGTAVSTEELQAALSAYTDDYEFGVRTGGGRSADPIATEAMELARQDVRNALVRQGKKLKDYKAQVISEAARKLVDAKPHYKELAAKRVAELQAAADSSLDDVMAAVAAVPAITVAA